MSKKTHKGNHAGREERRAARLRGERARASAPTTIQKPRRVYLRNGLHIFLTLLVVLAAFGAIFLLGFTGWWDGFLGSVLVIAIGAIAVACIVDLGLLISSCVAFGEGMVNAGKNAAGERMLFHAASVVRMEVRDTNGHALPAGERVYRNVDLAFVMESGRVNLKRLSRLTEKQIAALEAALMDEKKA